MLNKIIDMKTRTFAKPIYLICKQVKTKKNRIGRYTYVPF